MKMISILLFILPVTIATAFPQNGSRNIKNDSCIVSMGFIKSEKLDSAHILVKKSLIDNLIKYISNCNHSYKYPASYRDRGFSITLPAFLPNHSFEFGDNHYAVCFNDSAVTEATVVIAYDFDGSYHQWFLQQVSEGKLKASSKIIASKEFWSFTNYDDRFAGRIFMSNNTFISYYTRDTSAEKKLQAAILSFAWK
jgi:hypothetical protein